MFMKPADAEGLRSKLNTRHEGPKPWGKEPVAKTGMATMPINEFCLQCNEAIRHSDCECDTRAEQGRRRQAVRGLQSINHRDVTWWALLRRPKGLIASRACYWRTRPQHT